MIACLVSGTVAAAPADAGGFDLKHAIATAADGTVIQVPAGVYEGPFVIDRSVVLVGEPGAILDGGGSGDVVRVTAEGVTIRGFTIRHTGTSLDRENAGITALAPHLTVEDNVLEDVLFGIYCKGAADSVIRGNVIGGKDLPVQRRGDGIRIWQSHRTLIENNVVTRSRDAVMWFSDEVHLRNNRITHGRYGLHFMYSDGNVLEDNYLAHNSVGAFLMYSKNLTLHRNVFAMNRGPSGYGVGLKDMDDTDARENYFVGNRVGLHIDTSPSSLRSHDRYTRNVFAFNDVGIAFLPAVKRNSFVDNTFEDNIEQVAVLGGGQFGGNDFTVDGRGNFWSDYRGYDLDQDGRGDLPYRSESLFENLMDREPKLRLFLFSPAQQAIEMAARAFPIVRPRPKFSDTAPLMERVPLSVPLPGEGSPWPLLAVGGVLVALGAAGLGAGGRPFAMRESGAGA